MKEKSDLHMHTIASDGEMTAMEILLCAQRIGLTELSITDHDAIGAFTDEVFQHAQHMGIRLVTGIEMDSEYNEVEIHVLGYGIDIQNKELLDYLAHVHGLRRKRITEQIKQINNVLGNELLKESEIFIPGRETLMKPHLVHTLLKTGDFTGYRDAARWISNNTHDITEVPKPGTAEICGMIKRCGGKPFLAHPGFYIKESGLDIDEMITQLIPAGLVGLETDYPYENTSPQFQTKENERQMVALLNAKAKQYKLLTSAGSDAHQLKQMEDWVASRY